MNSYLMLFLSSGGVFLNTIHETTITRNNKYNYEIDKHFIFSCSYNGKTFDQNKKSFNEIKNIQLKQYILNINIHNHVYLISIMKYLKHKCISYSSKSRL